jgi:hypothetical protein
MYHYTITIGFASDRELTEEELSHIEMQATTQVEEPVDNYGDDMDVEIVEVKSNSLRLD